MQRTPRPSPVRPGAERRASRLGRREPPSSWLYWRQSPYARGWCPTMPICGTRVRPQARAMATSTPKRLHQHTASAIVAAPLHAPPGPAPSAEASRDTPHTSMPTMTASPASGTSVGAPDLVGLQPPAQVSAPVSESDLAQTSDHFHWEKSTSFGPGQGSKTMRASKFADAQKTLIIKQGRTEHWLRNAVPPDVHPV